MLKFFCEYKSMWWHDQLHFLVCLAGLMFGLGLSWQIELMRKPVDDRQLWAILLMGAATACALACMFSLLLTRKVTLDKGWSNAEARLVTNHAIAR